MPLVEHPGAELPIATYEARHKTRGIRTREAFKTLDYKSDFHSPIPIFPSPIFLSPIPLPHFPVSNFSVPFLFCRAEFMASAA